jgi:hypothetical protein
MSHIVTIRTQAKDPQAIAAACRRLSLPAPERGTAKLFGAELTGILVKLPGWLYPVVIDPVTGESRYDNYEGHWGEQKHLHSFMQAYAIEKARIEAGKQGHRFAEQAMPDGSVKLTITPRA